MINKIFDELLSRYIHGLIYFKYCLANREVRSNAIIYLHGVLDCLEKIKLINNIDSNTIIEKMYYFVDYKG